MSLLAPLYLLGLLGLILPWILHRFSHHEPPEQSFPSTRFLEPTRPPATSKRKLRHWPLLLLRILSLALLCFLFAQPWLQSQNEAADAEAVQLVIVDNSFSMRAENRWERARTELSNVLDALPEKDAVQLFSFSGQLRAHTDLINDQGEIKSALSQVEPGYEAADFGELMRSLNKVAGDFDLPVSATFITDGQRTNLPVQMNTLLANRLEAFALVSVYDTTPVNYSLRAEARTSDSVTARVSVRLAASDVTGNETSNAVSKTVQVKMKDKIVASQAVELRAGEFKSIQFDEIALPAESDELFNVAFAESDFLAEDDEINIPVRGLTSVELAMTHIGTEPSEQAQVFVKTALETNGDAKVERFDVNAALSATVRHAVVFVDDIASVPNNVKSFLVDGGNVLLLPARAATANNDALLTNATRIARIDQAHPLALGDINWFDAGFYSTPALSLGADDRVLLALESGEPLLIEQDVIDGGRLIMLNDPLDGFGSDLPLQPAFVNLMQQVVHYFNASNALPHELEVGKSLFLPANSQVLTPEGDSMLELGQLGSSNDVRLSRPGVYTVLAANSSDTVSVVLGAQESNLAGLTDEEVTAWESRHDDQPESDVQESERTQDWRALAEQAGKQTLWRWLLPAVVLFLLMESLLANRMLWVRRDGL